MTTRKLFHGCSRSTRRLPRGGSGLTDRTTRRNCRSRFGEYGLLEPWSRHASRAASIRVLFETDIVVAGDYRIR